MKLADWLSGVVLAITGIVITIRAQAVPEVPGQLYSGAFFPTLVGGGLAVLGGCLALRGVRAGGSALYLEAWVRDPAILARLCLLLLVTLGAIFVMDETGFLLFAIVGVGALLLAFGVSPLAATLIAVAASFAIWFVFGRLLQIALPYGILENLIF